MQKMAICYQFYNRKLSPFVAVEVATLCDLIPCKTQLVKSLK